VAPEYGVRVKTLAHTGTATEPMRAQVHWFAPVLNSHHSVACYELQVCRLIGPICVSHRRGPQKGNRTEEVNEFLTVSSNILYNEYLIEGLKAGGSYKCRVRARIKGGKEGEYGLWLDVDQALQSEAFHMPATLPDAPAQLVPCRPPHFNNPVIDRRTQRLQSIFDANNTTGAGDGMDNEEENKPEEDEDDENNDEGGEDGENEEASSAVKMSAMTIADSLSSHFDQPLQGPQFILSGDVDNEVNCLRNSATFSTLLTEDRGCELWEVTHDSVKLCWVPGEGNGSPIEELQVQRAWIRRYRCEDLLKLSALICDRDAFAGLEEDTSDDEENEDDDMDEDPEDDPKDKTFETASIELDDLEWVDITKSEGRFLSAQIFLATNLQAGQAYCFRVRQRNALGWSDFSPPSPVIGTHPALPPQPPSLQYSSQTFVVVELVCEDLLSTLDFEAQILSFSSDIERWSPANLRPLSVEETAIYSQHRSPQKQTQKKFEGNNNNNSSNSTTSSTSSLVEDAVEKELNAYRDLLNPLEEEEEGEAEDHGRKGINLPSSSTCTTTHRQHMMLQGLVEGLEFRVRVRRRTVLGWSPFSLSSDIFRTHS
jgi:hypothetical protein